MLYRVEIIEVLNGAIKVLEDNKWTRNFFARDSHSRECEFDSEKAVSFCAFGAMKKAAMLRGHTTQIAYRANNELFSVISDSAILKPIGGVSNWNDCMVGRKRDVISAFRKTIKSLENKAQG